MSALSRDLRKTRFWKHFAIHGFSALGVCVALLEVLQWVLGDAFNPQGALLGIFLVIIATVYGLIKAWPRPIQYQLSAPNTLIRIKPGNLLDETGDLVIGVTDTFDTQTPNIIEPSSVQAQMAQRLFNNDLADLDRHIDAALAGSPVVGTIEKPGKTTKYGLGSVATLVSAGRKLYLLAYTEMNENNNTKSSPDGIWTSLHSLWAAISSNGNGHAVSVPVIGQGQSNLSQYMPAQDAIRLTLLSFIFASRERRVCDELVIVVLEKDFEKLDRLELQAFLKSLQPS